MSERIALADLRAHRATIGADIDRRMAEVVAHGRWINGPEVAEFERAAEHYVGGDVAAVACGNGTDALVLAFQALGLTSGQAVLCPSFTFVATAEAVVACGAVPVFVDVGLDDFNLCPDSVRTAYKAATEEQLDVVGMCAVDLFGAPAKLDQLGELAEELGCWLVSDAAQSFGAEAGGHRVGRLAAVTTTSFFPAKPLGCYGDGGMVLSLDHDLASVVRSLGSHGKGGHKYENVRIGQNSRLDSLQAAVLLVKLDLLDWELAQRRRVADRYSQGLAGAVGTPEVLAGNRSAWAQYTITTDGRDRLQQHLNDQGIDTAIYYPRPLHRQPAYTHFELSSVDLSRTDHLTNRVLSLPMHPYLADDQIDRVIEAVQTGLD